MGLDMYLTRKTYVKNWDHLAPDERFDITVSGPAPWIKSARISHIEEEVMYWRKVNAIHRWFVNHVQDGEDDCREYCVSDEQLQELRDSIQTVLKARTKEAAELVLPTQGGFFFGPTEYGDYYWAELERTAQALTALLAEVPANDFRSSYYYRSSR